MTSTYALPRTSELWNLLQRLDAPHFAGHPACAEHDPELFQPISEEAHHQIAAAKSVCQTCPIQGPCLAFALRRNEVGIWGGTTETERRELRASGLVNVEGEAA